MKHLKNHAFIVLLAFVAIFVSSCNTDDNLPAPEPNLSVVNEEIAINAVIEDLDNITLSVLSKNGLAARTTVNLPVGELCPGAIITMDKTNKKITIDFGSGCTSENGTIRKGKIMLSYNGNLLFPGAKVVATFDDYEVNGFVLEGVRTLLNKSVDLESNSISLEIKVENAKVTWPDNTFVTFSSNETRKIEFTSEGYIATAKGTASGISKEGFAYTSVVTTPLEITQKCLDSGKTVPSSGMINFKYDNMEVTVDYGDGTCDNLVRITYPGGSKDVIID